MDWEALLENWPRAFFVTDGEGGIVFKNRAMSGLETRPAENLRELLDKPPGSLFDLARGGGSEQPSPVRTTVKLIDGPLCDLILSPLPRGGGALGRLRPLEDDDEERLRRLEEVIQEIRRLGHDMCQPLTVIMGQTEIMQMTQTGDEETGRRLEAILSEAEKLERMTRRLSLTIQHRHEK